LAWSLHEIAKASNVGLLINRLPVASEAKEFAEYAKMDLTQLIFYGGEEYEILLAIKPDEWAVAAKTVAKLGGQLLQIGRVTGGKKVLMESNGTKRTIEPRGYEHFRT
jgi:thiamine-monophosphate kinase